VRVAVVLVCYRVPDLTIDALRSLEPEVARVPGVVALVCENGTGAGSRERIAEAVREQGWGDWVRLVEVTPNRGFAGGNNVLIEAAMRWPEPPEYFLLLNADTIVRRGAVAELLRALEQRPEVGIVGPRLTWPDGTPQVSCFRYRSMISEFLIAARTAPLTRMLARYDVPIPVPEKPRLVPWLSFACALIRREVVESIGPLDDGYYLYFDDVDYCRQARRFGWKTLYWPEAEVVHLRGKSNPVKERTLNLKRRPIYYYASRSRYFAKFYGTAGLWVTNVLWSAGRAVSRVRELLGSKERHVCEAEWRDIWKNAFAPMTLPPSARGHPSNRGEKPVDV
jgi:GT2 family glycosyltransferase